MISNSLDGEAEGLVEGAEAPTAPAPEVPTHAVEALGDRNVRRDVSQILGHGDWETGEFNND